MAFDVFISYAWTNHQHREWVRLLASHLRLIGFNVGIDANVDYGNDLNGFMRKIKESNHVLMIIDENYAKRANDHTSKTGVSYENQLIESTYKDKPEGWIAPLLINNDKGILPDWLAKLNLKYFDFRSYPNQNDFPGSSQIEEIWRWLAGLAPDQQFSTPPSVIRERLQRVEKINELKSPSHWAHPELEGTNIRFDYPNAPQNAITVGYGTYEFKFSITACSNNSVYVYSDYNKGVGLIPDCISEGDLDARSSFSYITPTRSITPISGQSFCIMNKEGCLCVIKLKSITPERLSKIRIPSSIVFDYRILVNE